MDAKLYVSRLGGAAAVPPSKSAANRTVLCAGLSQGVSRLDNLEYSADFSVMLDAITQAQIWHFLLEYTQNNGVGLVMVTHSPALLQRLATRVIEL